MAAIESLLQLDSTDRAGLYFRKAVQLQKMNQTDQARRDTLKALEQAPRYREGLALLLALQPKETKKSEEPKTPK